MNITQINHVAALVRQAVANDGVMGVSEVAPTGDDYNTLYALVTDIARAVKPIEVATVKGESASREVASELVAASVSFMVEPEGDNAWTFAVKREHATSLRRAVRMAVPA